MAVDTSIVERAARLTREKIAPRAGTYDRDAAPTATSRPSVRSATRARPR